MAPIKTLPLFIVYCYSAIAFTAFNFKLHR